MKPKKDRNVDKWLIAIMIFFSGMTSYSLLSIIWKADKLLALKQAGLYFVLCIFVLLCAVIRIKSE